jgi:hypothetical protein
MHEGCIKGVVRYGCVKVVRVYCSAAGGGGKALLRRYEGCMKAVLRLYEGYTKAVVRCGCIKVVRVHCSMCIADFAGDQP